MIKYKAIKESPHRASINKLLILGTAHRKISEKLKREYGLLVSHKTLSLYHRDELDSLVVSEESTTEETPESFEYLYTPQHLENLVSELCEAGNSFDTKKHAKTQIYEVYALLTILCKESLKRHMRGESRFPADYLTKLCSVFGLLAK